MNEFLIGMVIAIVMIATISVTVIQGNALMCKSFANGERKAFSWSTTEQLTTELAKGYEIEYTYNVTNMILKKVSK